MLELVVRKRTPDRTKWERFVATVEGDNDDRELRNTLEVGNYPRYTKGGERVICTPLEETLYLLGYLMVVHQERELPTVQQVLDALQNAPEDVKQKVWGFEWHHGFWDEIAVTDFFDLADEGKDVSFMALFTKEDTGRPLPGVKLKFDRPIGITDEQWEKLYCKYSRPYYGYIDP